MIRKMILLLYIGLMGIVVYAQSADFTYKTQRDGKLIYIEGSEETVIRDELPDYRIKGWNPTGRYFMIILPDPNDSTRELMLIDDKEYRDLFAPTTDIDIDATYPLYFSVDNVIFTESTYELLVSEDEEGLGVIEMNVYEWAFEEGHAAITLLGAIPYGLGCGGGGVSSAIDIVYGREVKGDVYGQYNRKFIAVTPYGIVHNNGCTAIRTLLTNPETVESIELGDNLRWSVVSPDGEWTVGTTDSRLILVNHSYLNVMEVASADAPIYSITWSEDSSGFYYVSRTHTGEQLPINDPNNVLETYDPIMTVQMPSPEDALAWQSTIYWYDLGTGESTEVHRADAYAIGEITQVNDLLVFTRIEYATEWVQAAIDGSDDMYNTDLIAVTLWQFNISNGETTQVGDNIHGLWVRPIQN